MTAAAADRPSLGEMAEAVASGAAEPCAFVAESLEAIRQDRSRMPSIHAFLWVDENAAVRTVERAAANRLSGPLAGVPVAIKDNMATLELPTTCGSRILDGYCSPFEATAVQRLKDAGAVVVGKTNLDEFAMGSSTENSAIAPTRNPRDPTRVPGGSSGGSAAAVAAGMVPGALGSDTGGSVRQPASFCGVVGIKPTYGRVSRYGLVAFASSLDQIGTFGRSVRDAALLLQVIAGPDPRDSTCGQIDVPDLLSASIGSADGMVVGVPDEYFPDSLDAGVRALCDGALARMQEAGAEVRRVSLPHTEYAVPTYYIIATAEASSNLARYDGVRYGPLPADAYPRGARSTREFYELVRSGGFGSEVKRRIMLGTYVLSAGYYEAFYGRAQKVRALIAQDFARVFDAGVHVVFTPTSPTVAFRIGEKVDDPLQMYLSDIFTVTANLAGLPAISLPIGSIDGLPVGGQILARRWDEATMVRAATVLEGSLRRRA